MRKLIIALVAGALLAPIYSSAQTPPADQAGRGGARGARGAAGNEGATPQGPALKIDNDLEYTQAGGQSLKLNLYRVLPATAPLPVLIWIHGSDGALANRSASPMTGIATANGYALASIDYRSGTRAQQLADVKAAIRWVRANSATYQLDGAHIGVIGHDVGGQLAALAGTTADVSALNEGAGDTRVQAVVDIAGPVSTGGLDPSTYVTTGDAPTLIFHGSADAKVSTRESQKLIVPLKVAGIDATLNMPFGVGHDLGDLMSTDAVQTTTAFLNQHLKGVSARGGLSAFISTPAHTYVDPIALDLGGTKYGLYPTPSHGTGTVGSYRIYLPPDYATNPGKRYPVIYFLHGRSVDSKRPITAFYISRADAAIRSGAMPSAIIVLVQGDNQGWYLDAQDGRPMESILIKDLIPYIDKTYRTIATRDARAIEGHSMGGYGALHIGFKYPDLFSAVTGNSPALVENTTDDVGDQAFWESQKPATLAKANLAKVKTQKIRIIVGDKDNLFAVGKKLDEDLTALGVNHEFHGVVGSPHNHDQLVQYETFDTMAFYATAFKK
jgi:endo-1,4-beta-xylanase